MNSSLALSGECDLTRDDEYYCDNLDSAFNTIMEDTSINNRTLIIDDGSYEASTQLTFDCTIAQQNESFVIRGANNGKNSTLINKVSCCSTTLFYAYIDDINGQRPDVFLEFKDFSYSSQYGLDQPFGYFHYVHKISLSNVIFNVSYGNSGYVYSLYNSGFLHACYMNSLIVDNVQFYVVHVDHDLTYLFYVRNDDSVSMQNILVDGSKSDDDTVNDTLSFGVFYGPDGDLYFDNITIMNYGVRSAFYFYDNDYSSVHLANIIIDNVFVTGTLFTFYGQDKASVTMENMYVNGNGNTISNRLLYFTYNNYYSSSSTFTIDNSIFTNFVFFGASSYSCGIPFHFDYNYFSNIISFHNLTFSNLTTLDKYGLIYLEDDFEIEIIDCVFENNVGFIGLIHCASGSYCDVTIKNSVFVNNDYDYDYDYGYDSRSTLCYDGAPIINSIYLETGSYATLVMTRNAFYYYGPTVIYDVSSSVTISNDDVIDQVSSDDYYCREGSTTLYLSTNGTASDEKNDCTDEDNPCSTWNDIMESVVSGDTIKIGSGQYNVSYPLMVDVRYSSDLLTFSNNYANFTIVGNGEEKTTLFVTENVASFVWFYMYDYPYTFGSSIKISDLTYYPKQGMNQQFGYFYYGGIVDFSNIIVNGKDSDTYSSYDLIYGYQLETFIINNMEIYDIVSEIFYGELFALYNIEKINISNVLVSTDSKSSESGVKFGDFSNGDSGCSIDLENIVIKDCYSSSTMKFDKNNVCDIRLNHVTLDNVDGGIFFYFDRNSYCDITMDNILVNGNDKYLKNSILYYYSNNDTTLEVTNSIFANFQVESDATKVFSFVSLSAYSSSGYDVEFDNVTFENMEGSSNTSYGLIYVSDDFNVQFNNCKFRNNVGFVAMIHCNYGSNCHILIQDSTFSNNNGGYYNCMSFFF